MPQWTIDRPERLTFGRVASLDVRIVAGRLAVLASDGPPTLEVTELEGSSPLLVAYDEENERLTVTYKDLTWDGMIGWLRKDKRRTVLSITVPKNCSVSAGVVTASAVVSGFENSTQAKSVSGEIVFDGVSGDVNATTVSGDVESRAMVGNLAFKSVSGDLSVADGTPRRLRANTGSGKITADLALPPTAHVKLNSISGDILLRLPPTVEADVTLRSTSGTLSSSFDGL